MAMTGATIGKIGRIVKGEAYIINQRVLMFKPHINVNKDYLYYVLNQKDFGKYILNYVDSESAQPNISAGTIGKFEFNLPEMDDEQIRVGKVLRNLDEKIEIDKQINDNLEQQAMTMIEDYITDVNESIVLNRILSFVNGYAFSEQDAYLSEENIALLQSKMFRMV